MEHQKAGSQYMTGSVSRGGEGVVRIPGDPENSPEKSLKALRAVVLSMFLILKRPFHGQK